MIYIPVKKFLVVGPTGVGKSSFIQHYSEMPVEVGHTLQSKTTNAAEYVGLVKGEKVCFSSNPLLFCLHILRGMCSFLIAGYFH